MSLRIRHRSIILIASQAVANLATILLFVILVRMITDKAVVGSFRQVLLVYGVAIGLLSVQFDKSMLFFMPTIKSRRFKGFLGQTVGMTLVNAALIGVVMFVAAPFVARAFKNAELIWPLRIFSLYPLVHLFSNLPVMFFLSVKRAIRSGLYAAIIGVGRTVVVLVMFHYNASITQVCIGMIVFSAVLSAVSIIDIFAHCPGRLLIGMSNVKKQFNYCWPIWLLCAFDTVQKFLDKIIISVLFTAGQFAVFTMGAMEIPIITLITSNVGSAMMPELVTYSNNSDSIGLLELWQKGARKTTLVLLPCFALLLCCSKEIIVILYTKSYIAALGPFVIYLVAILFRSLPFTSVFRATGRTKILPALTITQFVVNVVVSLSLVYIGWGTYLAFIGPCIGTLTGQAVLMVLYVIFFKKMFNYGVSDSLLAGYLPRLFTISVLPCILCLVLPYWPEQVWLRVISKGAVYTILCSVGLFSAGYVTIPVKIRKIFS